MANAIVVYKRDPGDPTDVIPECCCPNCQAELEHFSGLEGIPEHMYCPECVDVMYDVESGKEIGRLE